MGCANTQHWLKSKLWKQSFLTHENYLGLPATQERLMLQVQNNVAGFANLHWIVRAILCTTVAAYKCHPLDVEESIVPFPDCSERDEAFKARKRIFRRLEDNTDNMQSQDKHWGRLGNYNPESTFTSQAQYTQCLLKAFGELCQHTMQHTSAVVQERLFDWGGGHSVKPRIQ